MVGAQPEQVALDNDLADPGQLRQQSTDRAVEIRIDQLDLDRVAVQSRLQVLRGAFGNDLPMVDDCDLTGQPVGLLKVVRRQQDGQAFVTGQVGDLVPQVGARLGVEAGGRFVEDSTFGRCTRPSATSSLRCMPPEYVLTWRLPASVSPNRSSSSAARRTASVRDRP
ncbi:MAG TPA: hypothetical protein VIH10_16690 [Kribbella sp.]